MIISKPGQWYPLVDQKKDAVCRLGFKETIHLSDGHVDLAGAGRHSHQQMPLAADDRGLDLGATGPNALEEITC